MAEAPAALRRSDSFPTSPLDAPRYLSDLLPEYEPEMWSYTPPVSDQIAYWSADRLEGGGIRPRNAMNVGKLSRDRIAHELRGL